MTALFSNIRTTVSILILCCATHAGEPPPPPVPPVAPAPVTPPKPVITVNPANQARPAVPAQPANPAFNDLSPQIVDFQSADPAKQEAATKILIEAGARGHAMLANLIKSPNADVAKRATEVRQQIDARSFQLYQETAQLAAKVQKAPLTKKDLDDLRQAWLKMGTYSSQNQIRQIAFKNATDTNALALKVDQSNKQLDALDAQLKTDGLNNLARAALQLERAGALRTLQRDTDALAAAELASQLSGKEGRHTPAALKLQAELSSRLDNNKRVEEICRQLIAEYPRSLEINFAHTTLLEMLSGAERWDEAIAQAKASFAAFPLDEAVQDAIYSMLETLFDEKQDYKRVGMLSEWLADTLPADRLKYEVAKYIGGCNEYITKDYARAQRGYTLLREKFADVINPRDMDGALTRVKMKAEGKFPAEPKPTDAGLAGVFGKFLVAVRARDEKAIAMLVPKDEVEDYVDIFKEGGDSKIPIVTFSDFVLKKVDEKGDEAMLDIAYYEASSEVPRPIKQEAIKEDGQWKIVWEDPADEEEPTEQAQPVVPQFQPPQQPVPAPVAPPPAVAPPGKK